jgi:hypothetical protein
MKVFPSLVPSTRLYVPGDLPQSRMQSLSGVDASFRRGNRRVGQALNLNFANLQEADLTLLTQHYIDVQGSFDRFFLSGEVWSGLATPPIPIISDYTWRYASTLLVSHASCGRFNVEVELVTEAVDPGDLTLDMTDGADPTGGGANPVGTPLYIADGLTASPSPARSIILDGAGADA